MRCPRGGSDTTGMSTTTTVITPTTPLPPPATDRALQRWLDPTELERRLEAHLLIARKITA